MIIDSHTHLWPENNTNQDLVVYFKKRNIYDKISKILTAEGLLQKMDENEIEVEAFTRISDALRTAKKPHLVP